MNVFKQKDDKFLHFLKNKKDIKASKEAREKSLLAFQNGIDEVTTEIPKPDQKRQKFRKQITGIFAALTTVGIAGLIFLSSGILETDRTEKEQNAETGNGKSSDVQYIEEQTDEQNNENNQHFLNEIFNRTDFDYNDLNTMPTKMIFNEQLEVHLPNDWTVHEEVSDQGYSIQMVGSQGEQMKLLLFNEGYTKEKFNKQLQELTADFDEAAEVSVPVDELIDNMRKSHEVPFQYSNVFPFKTENAKMFAFFDEEKGRFLELYISELFGYPMIFTSELSLDDVESWKLPLIFFTYMYIGVSPLTINGSEGDIHSVYDRPVNKSVILQTGAFGVEQFEVELYVNDELGLTSYLPSNTDIERIEHEYFTEWRFTEPNVSENSYYSFGKLKDDFPIENGKTIMFEALNIEISYYQESDGIVPYHYIYSGGDGEYIDGFIELFEVSGEWYFKHKHADRSDYNGGVYLPRLEMFINLIEWY